MVLLLVLVVQSGELASAFHIGFFVLGRTGRLQVSRACGCSSFCVHEEPRLGLLERDNVAVVVGEQASATFTLRTPASLSWNSTYSSAAWAFTCSISAVSLSALALVLAASATCPSSFNAGVLLGEKRLEVLRAAVDYLRLLLRLRLRVRLPFQLLDLRLFVIDVLLHENRLSAREADNEKLTSTGLSTNLSGCHKVAILAIIPGCECRFGP